MEEVSAKRGTAIERSKDNKYFVEFLAYQKKEIANNPEKYEGVAEDDDVCFLEYMTKKYFKDNIVGSIIKAIIGLAVLIAARFIFKAGASGIVSIVAILMFLFGIVYLPVGLFLMFSNMSCLKHYKDYSASREDPFMDKLILYYNDAGK